MTNRGRVIDVWDTEEPASGEPCLGVQTDATNVSMSPWNRPCDCIYVRPERLIPAVGDVVEWGPHHWWLTDDDHDQFDKLGNSFNRDDPFH